MRIKGFISADVAEKGWDYSKAYVPILVVAKDCDSDEYQVPCTIVVGETCEDELAAVLREIVYNYDIYSKNVVDVMSSLKKAEAALERYEEDNKHE